MCLHYFFHQLHSCIFTWCFWIRNLRNFKDTGWRAWVRCRKTLILFLTTRCNLGGFWHSKLLEYLYLRQPQAINTSLSSPVCSLLTLCASHDAAPQCMLTVPGTVSNTSSLNTLNKAAHCPSTCSCPLVCWLIVPCITASWGGVPCMWDVGFDPRDDFLGLGSL